MIKADASIHGEIRSAGVVKGSARSGASVDGDIKQTLLKGDKGDPGLDGKDGKDGKDGNDGKDGEPGYTPIKGIDYFDGEAGPKGDKGDTYALTEQDKTDIADLVLDALPTAETEGF